MTFHRLVSRTLKGPKDPSWISWSLQFIYWCIILIIHWHFGYSKDEFTFFLEIDPCSKVITQETPQQWRRRKLPTKKQAANNLHILHSLCPYREQIIRETNEMHVNFRSFVSEVFFGKKKSWVAQLLILLLHVAIFWKWTILRNNRSTLS